MEPSLKHLIVYLSVDKKTSTIDHNPLARLRLADHSDKKAASTHRPCLCMELGEKFCFHKQKSSLTLAINQQASLQPSY